MKRARVIYNPSSGREEAKKMLAEILETYEEMGYETSAYATKGKGDATREAERVCSQKFDLLVSVGGDGTLYEIINGMAEKEYRPALSVLPMGTSNDFASSLGIPKNIRKALKMAKKEKKKRVDIGKMNKKYFINVAGGGTLTELSYEVPSKIKTIFGQLAYYIKGAEKIAKLKPYQAEIMVGDELIKEEILLFLVANSHIIGSQDKISIGAKIDDGLLDVYVLKKMNIAELGSFVASLLKGEHQNDSSILHYKTDYFSVKSTENIQINLDGELGGMSPCEITILPQHIEVIGVK